MIIRQLKSGERVESAITKEILNGRQRDVEMLPIDILFVPTNAAKSIVKSTVQTAISAVTSALIYQGF